MEYQVSCFAMAGERQLPLFTAHRNLEMPAKTAALPHASVLATTSAAELAFQEHRNNPVCSPPAQR